MRRTWWLMAVASGLCLLLPLGACGDDDSASQQDEDDVTAAIERSVTSGDPKACVDAQTQQFTEQTTGDKGGKAVEQCKEDAEDSADKVEVSNLEIDGDSASADVAITGSFFGGQEIAVNLVKDNDTWKLDRIEGFVDGFDQQAFNESFKKEIAKRKGVPPGAADCVEKNVAKLSDEQINELFIESNNQIQNQVFETCFGQ